MSPAMTLRDIAGFSKIVEFLKMWAIVTGSSERRRVSHWVANRTLVELQPWISTYRMRPLYSYIPAQLSDVPLMKAVGSGRSPETLIKTRSDSTNS
jgi:hypothetical protein